MWENHNITLCQQRKEDKKSEEEPTIVAQLEKEGVEQEYFDSLDLSEDQTAATIDMITAVREEERLDDLKSGFKK